MMCRHLAYLGEPTTLAAVVLDPPSGLRQQATAPRHQTHGAMNVDGFGVGWYLEGDDTPGRYRRAVPIWADPSLPDLARSIRTGVILAAIRAATPGMAHTESAVAPFAAGRWLFSHNGALADWPTVAASLLDGVPAEALATLDAPTDSAALWIALRCRLEQGVPLAQALRALIEIGAGPGSRLNLLATDGEIIAATAWGNSLFWREEPRGVVVASEPYDDEAGWQRVPDGSLLVADRTQVEVTALPPPSPRN
jgi:glutamine amidotransferase